MLGAPIYFRYEHALNGYATRLPPAALAAIQADNRVLFVSEDREMFVDGVCTPQDFSPSVQCIPTGIDRIDGDLSSTKSPTIPSGNRTSPRTRSSSTQSRASTAKRTLSGRPSSRRESRSAAESPRQRRS